MKFQFFRGLLHTEQGERGRDPEEEYRSNTPYSESSSEQESQQPLGQVQGAITAARGDEANSGERDQLVTRLRRLTITEQCSLFGSWTSLQKGLSHALDEFEQNENEEIRKGGVGLGPHCTCRRVLETVHNISNIVRN